MKLNQIWSRRIIIAYLVITLGIRIFYESELGSYFWISFFTGFLSLLFLWALVKSGYLNPNWFWFENQQKGGEGQALPEKISSGS
ncbi:MAG: hypothetical protein NWR72_00530 [Bacteroidia bacterium]|nr:hypothetical protein [Bacteroidia bacterium]